VKRVRFSLAEARRIALAAQGFAAPRPAEVEARHLRRLTRRLGLLQIDSVNVLARAHYLPALARLGPYPRELLDRAAYDGRRRHLFEYWGHEASLLPIELYPLLRWRMADAQRLQNLWAGIVRFHRAESRYIELVFDEVRARGPIAASELEAAGERAGPWWGWSKGKRALEYLFWSGRVTTAGRRNFERVYDLTERVLPKRALAAPVPEKAAAQRELLLIAARALGIATAADLFDYFRLRPAEARPRLAELVDAKALVPATVSGWSEAAYLHTAAKLPRRITARALLSPFDPLVWYRPRAERLWGFHYRIEIYVPEAKRRHGYYVLPFLLNEDLVGRIDLKADRARGRLQVRAAHLEHGGNPEPVAEALLPTLAEMAGWLGLGEIELGRRGNLAAALSRARRRGARASD